MFERDPRTAAVSLVVCLSHVADKSVQCSIQPVSVELLKEQQSIIPIVTYASLCVCVSVHICACVCVYVRNPHVIQSGGFWLVVVFNNLSFPLSVSLALLLFISLSSCFPGLMPSFYTHLF